MNKHPLEAARVEVARAPNGLARRGLLKSVAAVAGALVIGVGKKRSFAGKPQLPLLEVEVNCGFKSDPSQLAYGRRVRDRLHQDALVAVERTRSQGYLAQLRAAEDVLERATASVDPARLRELWLSVSGSVGGRYRDRQYVVALTSHR